MKPILENAVLSTDLDCRDFSLLNVASLIPVPEGLVPVNDGTLNDPRMPPIGSVTDDSVSVIAGIEQSKLALSGSVPGDWLGSGTGQAAPGNLVERKTNKNVAGGYAGLDTGGKLPAATVTAGPGTGTVSSVALVLPFESAAEVTGGTIETSGSFSVDWDLVPGPSWFGVSGSPDLDATLRPTFLTSQIPVELIPPLDGSKFVSGVFQTGLLPPAIGMGVGHAPGILPDPGKMGSSGDYLGRDLKWHHFDADKTYQPVVPNVELTLSSWSEGKAVVTVREKLKGSTLFYRINGGSFIPVPSGFISISVLDHDFIEAYAAKPGYNNSAIAAYEVMTPATPL